MHLTGDNQKLIQRIRKIRGQLDGVERMLVDGRDCYAVLQNVAACRGAINGLTKELIQAHLKHHVIENPEASPSVKTGSSEIAQIIESFFK